MENEINNKLRQLQLEELKLLNIFIQICEDNKLRYYMLGGTLLGAVRHQGFIPWDDDVDVCMPREDYEQFIAIAKGKLEMPTYISCMEYDNNYRYCFARIATTEMKIKNFSAKIPRIEDVWIDIIPLDGLPVRKIELLIHKGKLFFWRSMNQIAQYDELVDQKKKRAGVEALLVKVAGWQIWKNLISYHFCMTKIKEELKKYKYDNSEEIINFMAADGFTEIFNKEWFMDGAKLGFEGEMIMAPINADLVLKKIYGNYMQLPPVDQRNKHNSEILG